MSNPEVSRDEGEDFVAPTSDEVALDLTELKEDTSTAPSALQYARERGVWWAQEDKAPTPLTPAQEEARRVARDAREATRNREYPNKSSDGRGPSGQFRV